MADRDAQKRIDDLFNLIETNARPFLKDLYDTGECVVTINEGEIERMILAQWSKFNGNKQPSDKASVC